MLLLINFLGGVRATVFAGLFALSLLVALLLGWRNDVLKDNNTSLEAEAAALVLAHNSALASRDLEHQKAVGKLRDSYVQDTKLALERRDTIIASLRAGNRRLHQRFSCPSRDTEAASAPSGSDGASGGGLLDSDAEFLVREAARADEVVRRLTMAQGIIASCTEEPK